MEGKKSPIETEVIEQPSVQYAKQPQRKLQIIEFVQDNCASCNALQPTIDQIQEKYKLIALKQSKCLH